MSAFHDNALMGASGQQGYKISRSVRLRSSASAYFNRTFGAPTSGNIFTWSGWVKRGAIGAVQPLFNPSLAAGEGAVFNASNQISIAVNGALLLVSTAVYRDPSAWYHIMLVSDMGNATASLRFRVYVNGVEVTAWGTDARASYSSFPYWNKNTVVHYMGYSNAYPAYGDGYLTEVNFIDGQALTPSSFGETDTITGVWKPKKYAGTYGTNGFYLNFSDNSNNTAATIGKDYSGNGNNWTPNNISVTAGVTYDSMLDTPTPYADGGNGRGNYCTLNPLQPASTTVVVPTDGNLKMTGTASGNNVTGTMAIVAATYFEGTAVTGGGTLQYGIKNLDTGNTYVYDSNGNKYLAGTGTAYGATYTTNDIIGVAVDPVNLTLQFYKNGTSQGVISSAFPAGNYVPFFYASNTNASAANFGQRPFQYTPPTGFKALNTQNLPESTILKPVKFFDATLWTGNQAARTITNSGEFQPDLIWTKSRSDAENHRLHDSARGGNGSVLYELNSNLTEADGTDTLVSGFASNGFTIASGANSPNITGRTYVGWQWKESAAAGFDIVTCATNGSGIITSTNHALGVTPSMIILKARAGTDAWYVYHKNSTATATQGTLQLNATSAVNTTNGTSGGVDKWTVSASAFAAGNSLWSYQANTNHIASLFAEVAGFSKFGSYTGNGSSDGPFVYCGFRPRFVMFKRTDTTSNWLIIDSVRGAYNADQNRLFPNLSNAEDTSENFDFLSNGFKLRDSAGSMNASGGTYIYAAFAENPFKNSLAR